MENKLDYVGQRIPRKEGPEKATGRAIYTVDIQPPGMLVGRILRSPHPHAVIRHLDTKKANIIYEAAIAYMRDPQPTYGEIYIWVLSVGASIRIFLLLRAKRNAGILIMSGSLK